jgi:hypothetical protein
MARDPPCEHAAWRIQLWQQGRKFGCHPTCNTNVPPISVTLFPITNWFAVAVCQSVNDDTAGNGADTIFAWKLTGITCSPVRLRHRRHHRRVSISRAAAPTRCSPGRMRRICAPVLDGPGRRLMEDQRHLDHRLGSCQRLFHAVDWCSPVLPTPAIAGHGSIAYGD